MDWFKIEKLPNDIYAVMEPYHFQEVISYLIVGRQAAVLLDTGAGIGNIARALPSVYNGEIIAVNSHTHFDHVGDNHRFPQVMVYNHPAAVARLKRGYSAAELAPHAKPSQFERAEDVPAEYIIPPSNPAPIEDGHVIDLGGRRLRVIHTPGHSPDSIMLLDEAAGVLFTGDSYYPGPLYCHYDGEFYGRSSLEDYCRSMDMAAGLDVKTVHPGHNRPVCAPSEVKAAAKALARLADGSAVRYERLEGDLTIASLPSCGEEAAGYVIPRDLRLYDIDGVRVIYSVPVTN